MLLFPSSYPALLSSAEHSAARFSAALHSLATFFGGEKMKKYKVEIEGVTPYMQMRMDDKSLEEWEKNRNLIIERNDVSKDDLERALFHAYYDNKGFFIPSDHIRGSLIDAGNLVKSKVGNKTKSMKNIVAGMFFVTPAKIRIHNDIQVDKRSAVNQKVKVRVICIRPRWDLWKVSFELNVDNDTITDATTKQIIEYAGQYCGIGSFRPTHNGMFGRFKITKFEKA